MKEEAKEEALRLLNQYLPFVNDWNYYDDTSRDEKSILEDAKKIATMNVNEVLNSHYKIISVANKDTIDFYEEVKFQISIL